MTQKRTPCEVFLERVGEEPRKDTSELHNLCPRCLRANGHKLPQGYADLGGLARCSVCGDIADCRDPEVLSRYAAARIDPSEVYLGMPCLRRPLNGPNITIDVIDLLILGHRGDGH